MPIVIDGVADVAFVELIRQGNCVKPFVSLGIQELLTLCMNVYASEGRPED